VSGAAKTVEVVVPAHLAGERLDRVLAELVPELSRRRAREVLALGAVWVGKRRVRRASAPVTAPPAVPPQTLEAEEDVTVVVQLLHGQPIIALRPVWTVTVCDHMLLPVMSAEGRVTYTRTVSVSALPCDLSLRADIDGTQVVEHWGRVGRSDVEQPLVIEAPARSLPLGLALARERDMFWRNLDSAPDRLHHRVRGMARSRVLDLLSEDEANAWLDDAMVAWLETR
jgi:hypothetical protein